MPYKVGDVVRLFYPYVPRVRQKEIVKQVARYENEKQPVFFEGKNRYGVVVGIPNYYNHYLSVVQIMSHGDVTNSKEYRLRDDELIIPSNIYVSHSGEERELKGVVKMERIEHFSKDEVSAPLNRLPLDCRKQMSERYSFIMGKPYYQEKLNSDSPKHDKVMRDFLEYNIASQLDFLVNDYGENCYQSMKRELFICNRIEKVGVHKDSNIYAVELKGDSGSFLYNISTKKSEAKVGEDWFGRKPAVYWLQQDSKFHVLKNNVNAVIQCERIRLPSELKSFKSFQKEHIEGVGMSKQPVLLERS